MNTPYASVLTQTQALGTLAGGDRQITWCVGSKAGGLPPSHPEVHDRAGRVALRVHGARRQLTPHGLAPLREVSGRDLR